MRKIHPKERLLIDAVLYDFNNVEAAYQEIRHSTTERPDMLRKMALRWWGSDAVEAYRATRTQGSAQQVAARKEKQEGRSKADIIAELNRLISTETDNKRRGDLLMKLSDLLRESPQEIAPENQHIHYYLPLQCSACELWQHFDAAQTEQDKDRRKSVDATYYSSMVQKVWKEKEEENNLID